MFRLFRRSSSSEAGVLASRPRSWRRRFAVGLLRVLAVLLLAAGVVVAWGSYGLPSVASLDHENPAQTSYMRRAIAAGKLAPDARLDWTPLGGLSRSVVCGLVKSEDVIFFNHHGINYRQTWLAAVGRAQGKVVGHSTITMQLARNLFLGPEQTFSRKLRELLLTRKLEDALPKARLLELYLNVMELGPGVWGVPQASQYYFQKPPSALDAFEGTFLGAIAPAPLQPLSGVNGTRAHQKQGQVLWRLFVSGVIGPAEYQAAVLRQRTVYQALVNGVPLREALARPVPADATPPALPPRTVSEEIPTERLLEEACGYAAELTHWRRGGGGVPKLEPAPTADTTASTR